MTFSEVPVGSRFYVGKGPVYDSTIYRKVSDLRAEDALGKTYWRLP